MRSTRFWVVVLLLCITLAVRIRRGDVDSVPLSRALTDLPRTLDSRSGSDIPIDPGVRKIMGNGYFLNRLYSERSVPGGGPPVPDSPHGPVALFIGYFPTQRSGQSIHSPQNCLPGSGWTFESSGALQIEGPNGGMRKVGEYLITDGTDKDEVLYWYQSHGQAIASDYLAKIDMLLGSVRYNRTDAALIRIITPWNRRETRADARSRAVHFAEQLAPLLPAYIPD